MSQSPRSTFLLLAGAAVVFGLWAAIYEVETVPFDTDEELILVGVWLLLAPIVILISHLRWAGIALYLPILLLAVAQVGGLAFGDSKLGHSGCDWTPRELARIEYYSWFSDLYLLIASVLLTLAAAPLFLKAKRGVSLLWRLRLKDKTK